MAKKHKNKERAASPPPAAAGTRQALLIYGVAFLLAAIAFLVYAPSLRSDFVYDARIEILEEGFITNLAHLPEVLSLKVLTLPLILGTRPGHLLYLMLVAAVSGRAPFGYHLGSNLLHALNTALLFLILIRLALTERPTFRPAWKVTLAAVCTLLFALHPISTESVAEISYSSTLLVALFTFAALLAAMVFRPERTWTAFAAAAGGIACAFAAVTCKESGVAVVPLLIIYWRLFRREENPKAWCWFLGVAGLVALAFLVARFTLAPPFEVHVDFLGGSFPAVFEQQPPLWVFMLGQLLWPQALSADYLPTQLALPSLPVALLVLALLFAGQAWLAWKSRPGALGVALYWLGLATVSNFFPILHPVADRYEYLPLAGLALQLFALLLLADSWRIGPWPLLAVLVALLPPLTFLTLQRQAVFASEIALWTSTLQVSPGSWTAYNNLGTALLNQGRINDALADTTKAVELNPNYPEAHNNLAVVLASQNRLQEALDHYKKALDMRPHMPAAWYNLGNLFLQARQWPMAVQAYQRALEINPDFAAVYNNFGTALLRTGQIENARDAYIKAIAHDPHDPGPYNNLGSLYLDINEVDSAMAQFRQALRCDPHSTNAHFNLGNALLLKKQGTAAAAEFEEVVRQNPNDTEARQKLQQARALGP